MRNQLVMIVLSHEKSLDIGNREAWCVHVEQFNGAGEIETGDAGWMDSRDDAIHVAEHSL